MKPSLPSLTFLSGANFSLGKKLKLTKAYKNMIFENKIQPVISKPLLNYSYWLSLPERLVLAVLTALAAFGFEISRLILPVFLRKTKIYQATVERMFRIVIELFGQVEDVFPKADIEGKDLLYRKTAGNVAELAGLVSMGYSPIWVLAVTSDVVGGSRVVFQELLKELKRDQIIDENQNFQSTDDLMEYLEKTRVI